MQTFNNFNELVEGRSQGCQSDMSTFNMEPFEANEFYQELRATENLLNKIWEKSYGKQKHIAAQCTAALGEILLLTGALKAHSETEN